MQDTARRKAPETRSLGGIVGLLEETLAERPEQKPRLFRKR